MSSKPFYEKIEYVDQLEVGQKICKVSGINPGQVGADKMIIKIDMPMIYLAYKDSAKGDYRRVHIVLFNYLTDLNYHIIREPIVEYISREEAIKCLHQGLAIDEWLRNGNGEFKIAFYYKYNVDGSLIQYSNESSLTYKPYGLPHTIPTIVKYSIRHE